MKFFSLETFYYTIFCVLTTILLQRIFKNSLNFLTFSFLNPQYFFKQSNTKPSKKNNTEEIKEHQLSIIVNSSIKMSRGKLLSQISHLIFKFATELANNTTKNKINLNNWKNSGQPKIVLKASQDEIEEMLHKNNDRLWVGVIHDAGRTQIKEGSLTCMGLFGGMEEVKKLSGHLKLL